jgi:sugar lactone lactonase YvrE
MNPVKKFAISTIMTALLMASAASAQPGPPQRVTSTLATYPVGTTLENIAIAPSGDLFVTAIDSGTIFRVTRSGSSQVFGQVAGPLLGLAFDSDGTLIAVGGTSVYRFQPDGSSSLVLNIDGAVDLNGVTQLSPGVFLVADDFGYCVWRVDVKQGTSSLWLAGDLLLPAPDGLPFGPNGIKVFRGAVYISNTGASTLLRVPLLRDGSAGIASIYASNFQVDDFAFGSDGSVFAATQGGTIIRLQPNGIRTMISTGTLGDAAVAFGRTPFDLRDLYVVNNGGLFLGLPDGPLPASVVKIPVNMAGAEK